MKASFDFFLRALVFIIAFFLVVYFYAAIAGELGEFRDYFFRSGNYWMVIVILLFVLGVGTILKKLLLWEYRHESGIEKEKKIQKYFRRRWR